MANSGKTRWKGKHVHFGFVSNRYTPQTISANKTFANADGGLYVLSGSAVVTGTLPAVAKCAGSKFTFRVGSVHAHVLTASADDAGSKVFSVTGSQGPDANGTKMVLPNLVGSSVVFESDGVNFINLGHSGSLDVSGG